MCWLFLLLAQKGMPGQSFVNHKHKRKQRVESMTLISPFLFVDSVSQVV